MNRRPLLALLVTISLLLPLTWATTSDAEVERFEIMERVPFADGMLFGEVGAYERIVGRVFFAIDPEARQNSTIVDLDKAPRGDDGRVRFSMDLFILAPADLSRGNGALLYDVNNRGGKLALRFFNFAGGGNDPSTAADAGDGFLMRQGFVVVWSGWDGELLPGGGRMQLHAPLAHGSQGPISGPVRCEFETEANASRLNVSRGGHGSYWPVEQLLSQATLSWRNNPREPRRSIARDKWELHVTQPAGAGDWQLPLLEVELDESFLPGRLYELIYQARDPLVHGVCFAGVRDLVSALKHAEGEGNPLGGKIARAHGFGVSQSGRFLRELLYWGLNEDEQSRAAFDGLIPHVAGGGLGSFNHRFAQPTRFSTQRSNHDYPVDRFPFAYEVQRDPLSGVRDGILKRTRRSAMPLVMHTQSTAEYWTRAGSLPHTDPLGQRDARVPANVRFYSFGGTQHGPSGFPPGKGNAQCLANPGDYRVFLRALLLALDDWAEGEQPPASVYPTIHDGTLVDWHQEASGFPILPGIRYPGVIHYPSYWNWGTRWGRQIVDRQPPTAAGDYVVRVPAFDSDGNERGCLSPPEVMAPVASYMGWNLYADNHPSRDSLVGLRGSYIPFAVGSTERKASGDPRPSLRTRYENLERYLSTLQLACDQLHADGYLLGEDVERTMRIQRQRVAPLFESPMP
jgi:hypothetical protein